ncbi:MAG: 2-oxoacid:acceptor oxidoreductase subunit alpha [Candidatus Bathyarchaeota archaeon]|jgi:2-oxoglutarate ferredoxin oxidoreductase subunit alpha|nr:2-oxoacid:acceptor oxidoreductase subunit alpha [Candidatus Bathyarchaeota archaeon]
MSGDVACAEGAIAAGCRFFGGYPITPATEVAERMARRLPEVGGVYVQMEDEIGSIAAIIGASYAGRKAMTATSGPGFSLMQENIGLAVMTEAPIVIVDVMRGGPSTGQPTMPGQQDVMQAKWGSHGDYEIIALAPSSVQEVFELTIESFNLAETYRVPAILLIDEIIGHMWERLDIPPPEEIEIVDRKKPRGTPKGYEPFKPDKDLVPPMACFGEGYRFHATGLTHNESGAPRTVSIEEQNKLVKRLCDKIRKNANQILRVEEVMLDDAEIAVVAYGITSRAALSAVRKARSEGIKAGLIRLVTIWPFPQDLIHSTSKKVDALIVPEMNYGQLVREVERAAKTTPVSLLSKLGGEPHRPSEIVEAIRRAAR